MNTFLQIKFLFMIINKNPFSHPVVISLLRPLSFSATTTSCLTSPKISGRDWTGDVRISRLGDVTVSQYVMTFVFRTKDRGPSADAATSPNPLPLPTPYFSHTTPMSRGMYTMWFRLEAKIELNYHIRKDAFSTEVPFLSVNKLLQGQGWDV